MSFVSPQPLRLAQGLLEVWAAESPGWAWVAPGCLHAGVSPGGPCCTRAPALKHFKAVPPSPLTQQCLETSSGRVAPGRRFFSLEEGRERIQAGKGVPCLLSPSWQHLETGPAPDSPNEELKSDPVAHLTLILSFHPPFVPSGELFTC